MTFHNSFFCALIAVLLQACASVDPNSDYINVVPVKNIPKPVEPIPNSTWGRLETSDPHPDGYFVKMGDKRYNKIVEPFVVDGKLTIEAAISAVSSFAEVEVVARKLCGAAKVPSKDRRLTGNQKPSEVWVYVECIKP